METNYFIILYWFCHTLIGIWHGYTCVPDPEPSSHLYPHPILLGHPSVPVPSTLDHALNLDWWFMSYVIIYMFQCLPSQPTLALSHTVQKTSIHLCVFCCLAYRVIVTIFLKSIYVSVLSWYFSFWLTSLCVIGSSFIHLIRTDLNLFFLMA